MKWREQNLRMIKRRREEGLYTAGEGNDRGEEKNDYTGEGNDKEERRMIIQGNGEEDVVVQE